MDFEFIDNETIVVKADWINLFSTIDYFETAKRPTGYPNLFWWLRCHPNQHGFVVLTIHTSMQGFEIEYAHTVDRSSIKQHGCWSTEDPYEINISHEDIRSGKVIKNGYFVIRFKVNIKNISGHAALIMEPKIEDSCIVKLDRNSLQTADPDQEIIEQKRTVEGITWWIQYNLCGSYGNNDCLTVSFYVDGGPIAVDYSCAMKIDNILIQNSDSETFETNDYWAIDECFSHKLCQLADHNNGIIDLVCTIRFPKPLHTVPIDPSPTLQHVEPVETKPNNSLKDSVTFSVLECQLDSNEVGEYDSTAMKSVNGSDKHQWRILHYPSGTCSRSKGHISLIIEPITTETNKVILSGVIKIDGRPFEKKFNMFVEDGGCYALPKLISHEDLRDNGGIFNGAVKFTCDVSFETLEE